jgi:hypothetical protein
MTPFGHQKELVDDRRRNLAAQRHGSAWPVRLEAQMPAQTETRRWRAFSLLVVAFFMTIVDLTIVNVALPTIGVKLHFPQSDLQWVVTAYGLTFGGFLLLGGRAPAVEAGSARLWNIPAPARRARIRLILGQPGARLRIHDHAVPDIAARHPLHEPLRNGHPRLGAPR